MADERHALDVPLGYSAAGVVLETGAAVTGIRPGQLVATGGAGKANHAELQAVPWLLCAPLPAGVSVKDAAFTTLASIALHGLRLAEMGPGSKVVVVGLGLIGQLAARLAMAAGCDVAGIDPAAYPRETAGRAGVLALDERGQETTEQVLAWSRGRGADAVARGAPCRDAVGRRGDGGLVMRPRPRPGTCVTATQSASCDPRPHESLRVMQRIRAVCQTAETPTMCRSAPPAPC